MRTLAVIPARYASTRLPGKPLVEICGRPMIRWVHEAVSRARLVDEVVVATDDERIVRAVAAFGGRACLTSPDCASGTDRLVEIAAGEKADIYLNVQGDEPLLRPSDVDALIRALAGRPDMACATPCFPVSPEQALDPNLVKVVRADDGRALYFSRSRIPYDRDGSGRACYWGHLGMYAYRREALDVFARFAPGPLEQTEKLEQLRLLAHGASILTVAVEASAPGVDTPEDLARVLALLEGRTPEPPADPLARVRLVITDVDGVLTDGGLIYGAGGEELKRFHVHDGQGILALKKAGIEVAVLSGRDCPALRARLRDLNITLFRLGKTKKTAACRELLHEAGAAPEEAVFVGDDLPDLDGFACCGLGVTVADAPERVRKAAGLVLSARGGHGAFRELADRILARRGDRQ